MDRCRKPDVETVVQAMHDRCLGAAGSVAHVFDEGRASRDHGL